MNMENKKCECCRKILLDSFTTQKYCNNCSVHIKTYQEKIHFLREKIRKLGGFIESDFKIENLEIENG